MEDGGGGDAIENHFKGLQSSVKKLKTVKGSVRINWYLTLKQKEEEKRKVSENRSTDISTKRE